MSGHIKDKHWNQSPAYVARCMYSLKRAHVLFSVTVTCKGGSTLHFIHSYFCESKIFYFLYKFFSTYISY